MMQTVVVVEVQYVILCFGRLKVKNSLTSQRADGCFVSCRCVLMFYEATVNG